MSHNFINFPFDVSILTEVIVSPNILCRKSIVIIRDVRFQHQNMEIGVNICDDSGDFLLFSPSHMVFLPIFPEFLQGEQGLANSGDGPPSMGGQGL